MKQTFLFLFLAAAISVSAQKLKGSKNVTVLPVEIEAYDAIEITDNIDLFLTLGTDASAEIEADDNLHEIIKTSVSAGTLYISASEPVASFRQFSLKLTYTPDLKKITIKGDAKVTAMNDIQLPNLEVKIQDNGKLYGNIKCDKLVFNADGKSKSELNISGSDSTIEMTGNANMKALISSEKLTFDMYQKAVAVIEGDSNSIRLRMDNNAKFTGKNMTGKQVELTTEGYSETAVEVLEKAIISASGKSSIELYGEQKIEINKFSDSAVISKKNNKVK
ncbi:GIN domain-containing protein [Flavobacterium silvaticum]|uniref:DUF2807 domain-containing protein n=1 Tax=Flavobacterium silvaticum TaxID=1852020 RepID=A0A972JHK8_9FLAO|nr:DUF2807 domain-containing protein [Flavobacterium silvaticum]NMH29336.1 DUF2807 domain-containing protein [Flavobacterium silvaticum]